LGNICRSPTAHGVMESMLASNTLPFGVAVDSAGPVPGISVIHRMSVRRKRRGCAGWNSEGSVPDG
jgi:protein-tyrosine-phosphatase